MKSQCVTLSILSLEKLTIAFQDNDSHFHEALSHWKQLNLAPSFLEFARKTDGLSASMPLLLHNWRQIYDLWSDAFKSADDEGLRPLLEYVW